MPGADAKLMGVWKGSAEWGDYDSDGDLDLVLTGRDREDFPIAVIYANDGGWELDASWGRSHGCLWGLLIRLGRLRWRR
ncbi:MAG: hypothetical protein U5J63_14100 [Fodinibius sp.]|nr:hypothetical protein [Fodinibius sp.]